MILSISHLSQLDIYQIIECSQDAELESLLLQLREHVILFEKENGIIVPFLLVSLLFAFYVW